MRVLVVSDIHGNWPALEAVVATPHDAVVCLGDIVGYDLDPGACLRWVRERDAHAVQGNHDRALADDVPPRCRADFEWLAAATVGIGRRQLSEEEMGFLRTLPRTRNVLLDDRRLVLLHATPADPLYSHLGPDREGWRRAVAGLEADMLLVGHTHLPFHFTFGGRQVLNPGSLGQPKDGDPRAAFGTRRGRCREAGARHGSFRRRSGGGQRGPRRSGTRVDDVFFQCGSTSPARLPSSKRARAARALEPLRWARAIAPSM